MNAPSDSTKETPTRSALASRNWRIEDDTDGIRWLRLDCAHSHVNVLSESVLVELEDIVRDLPNASPKGVAFISAKQNGFIAGADVAMIRRLEDASDDDALSAIRRSQTLFDLIAALPFPTVALIQGYCLGGGLELALACRYRVAVADGAGTRLGLPEVKLGLHPGWGGTIRLPSLVGPLQASKLILAGRTVDARQALRMGLVDFTVPARQLEDAARRLVLHPPARGLRTLPAIERIASLTWARPAVSWNLRRQVSKRVRPAHYPAPFAVLDLWRDQTGDHRSRLEAEARSFLKLSRTETAHNLIRLFFLRERLKTRTGSSPSPASHIHVVGAGTMGGDIAAWCALQGYRVTLQDQEPKRIGPAVHRATDLFQKRFNAPRAVTSALDRLIPDTAGDGIARADVIIEAIAEDLGAKQRLFKELEHRAKSSALLASNTSSLSLAGIAAAMRTPGRVVGIHFFNPVARMMLVEVVRGEKTSQRNLEQAMDFVRGIDRLPLAVKDNPGFLVNRVLTPYLLEAIRLIAEGVSARTVDDAAVQFGMPIGPVELADTVGLDICLSVAEVLAEHFHEDIPQTLRRKVDAGKLGKKTGSGFYTYRDGRPVKDKPKPSHISLDDVRDRLIFRMLNEALECLRDHVVTDADCLDAGMVFGTGFAPFQGGPVNYLLTRGLGASRHRLEELRERFGDRFLATAGWESLKETYATR